MVPCKNQIFAFVLSDLTTKNNQIFAFDWIRFGCFKKSNIFIWFFYKLDCYHEIKFIFELNLIRLGCLLKSNTLIWNYQTWLLTKLKYLNLVLSDLTTWSNHIFVFEFIRLGSLKQSSYISILFLTNLTGWRLVYSKISTGLLEIIKYLHLI